MNQLPTIFQQFFWDAKLESINTQKNSSYIIDRLLKIGDLASWKWLAQTYSPEQIKNRALNSRQLTKKDATFYSLIFDLPINSFKCIKQA
ncbi:MAG: hypothetical protein ABIJ03_03485 [Patescibacteria group bacterium]